MQNFDIFAADLLAGKNLIEASAGTGKTYSIALLFLRLLLEKKLKISEILTVTFTRATAIEMKTRIKNFINETLDYLAGTEIKNLEIKKIIANSLQNKSQELVVNQLTEAKLFFDNAQIFTIHAFCQKILTEYAFECGLNPQTELLPDETALIKETVEDFFRLHLVNTLPQFAQYLNKENITPSNLTRLLVNKINDPFLKIYSNPKNNLESLLKEKIKNIENLFQEAKILWAKEQTEITNLLLKSQALNRQSYKEESILKTMILLNIYFDNPTFPLINPQKLALFTTSKINNAAKKALVPPVHNFFIILEDLIIKTEDLNPLFADYLSLKKQDLFIFLKEKLDAKKLKAGLFSYDDMISKTYSALAHKNSSKLRNLLNIKYRAILIDEFQDTNKTQCEIFNLISTDPQKPVYFIGDPKQSIYSFRGADIHAYLEISREANLKPEKKFTMFTNFRSSSNLVAAVNKIFSKNPNPFYLPQITFPQVSADKNAKTDAIPLTIFYKFSAEPISKTAFAPLITHAVAREIIKLNKNNSLDNKSVAILVRKNSETQLVKQIFSQYKIPAALCKADNVFSTPEAQSLLALINAVAKNYDSKFLKAALLTEPLGKDLAYLQMLNQNSPKLEELRQKFHAYYQLWQEHGFLIMYQNLIVEEKIKENLCNFPDFERKITNLNHLAQLLNEKELQSNLKIQGLIKFMEEQILNKDSFPEAYELQIESDEHSLQILTIHKSKGLEFDLVFCPFLWSDIAFKSEQISYHQNKNSVLDFSPTDQAILLAQNEELSEKLRLTYVAMTRAKEKLYLAWGNINKSHNSALAYLFHNHTDQETFKNISEEKFISDLNFFADNSLIELKKLNTNPELTTLFSQKEKPQLQLAKILTRVIKPQWAVNSFSSLNTLTQNPLSKSRDGDVGELSTPQQDHNIYSFPANAKTGLCWHEIMEKLDFSNPKIPETVTCVLNKYNLEINPKNNQSWVPVICEMAEKIINIFPISKIIEAKTLKELKFTFSALDEEIKSLNLNLKETDQFLTGIIDLIFEYDNKFYIIDWKSNYLGDKAENYNSENLKKIMQENNYNLQARIYELALHKYLKSRISDYDPKKHFGGSFYIFLRGYANNDIYKL